MAHDFCTQNIFKVSGRSEVVMPNTPWKESRTLASSETSLEICGDAAKMFVFIFHIQHDGLSYQIFAHIYKLI